MTKRIAYFDFWSDASSFYQLMPLDYISDSDLSITRETERDIKPHVLNPYDVVIFLRACDEAHLIAIRRARDMGKKVITVFDDDCLNLPNDIHPMYNHYQQNKSKTIECLVLSNEVWVSTESIRHSFRFYNPNIYVIPNAHNDFIFPVDKKPDFKFNKTALWRGGFSHINDIYSPGITEELIEIINTHKDWKFHFWGQRFEYIELRLKQRNHYRNNGGPTLEFYQSMHMLNPCLFFYPLVDTKFNRGKSNCSILESCYSGAAYFGNTGLSEMSIPGVIDFADLNIALKREDSELEQLLRSNHDLTWEYIKEKYLLSSVNETRKERLLSI